MSKRFFAWLFLVPALAWAGTSAMAQANSLVPSQEESALTQSGEIGPSQAATIVRKQTKGRVLGVRTVRNHQGKTVYRVKVLEPGGRIRIVKVGANGALL